MWHTGLVAPQHVGSSRTRAQTRVACIGRQILNRCTTREVPDKSVSIPVQLIESEEGTEGELGGVGGVAKERHVTKHQNP